MAMGNRHDDLWSGQILGHGGVDPDSPAGGSGPGKSRRPGPLREVVGASALPHPDAPAKRHSYIAKKSAHVVSARMLFIAKARARAISRLAARLKDLEAWDDATAQCFKGWFGSADKSARDTIRARIEAMARFYGMMAGVTYAEPFLQKEVGLVEDVTAVPVRSI